MAANFSSAVLLFIYYFFFLAAASRPPGVHAETDDLAGSVL